MRVLTGLQPSGSLHLGNYFSAIRKILEYQSKEELYLFIANLHSLTTFQNKESQIQFTKDAVLDLLALGVKPDQTVFWIQSEVPEVGELTWILSQCITVPQLQLAHSYKDKVAKGFTPSAGLFLYPILMAADILLFSSEKVPVGKDQKQHLEFARDIAERFNSQFGNAFNLPEPDIAEDTALVPGTDGAKMSKSYKNTINLFDSEKSLKKSIMSIVSDSKGIEEPKDPETSIIFQIHSLFLNKAERESLASVYRQGGKGYGDLKKMLLDQVFSFFEPFRKERERLVGDETYIEEILRQGRTKARETASLKIQKIRHLVGLPL